MSSDRLNHPSSAPTNHDVLQQFLAQGGSVHLLTNIPAEDLDSLYAYACQLFTAADFAAAKRCYFLLTQLDHWNFDYWLALGLCCQRLAEHEEAIFCFSRSGMIAMEDPRSSYFAGVSYQLLGNREYARKAFNASLKWCSQHAQYEELRHVLARSLAHCVVGE